MFEEEYLHDGSKKLEFLVNSTGLPVDLLNFLACQISALFIASLYRTTFHPSKVSATVRHIFGLIVGLFFAYFCYGYRILHIVGLPFLSYIIIRTQNAKYVHKIVFVVAFSYLLLAHLQHIIYNYGAYRMDFTGPLMIITQKVISIAFHIHDGYTKDFKIMTEAQQYHALRKIPSLIQYLSYTTHFQGLLAGPLVFYKDYIEFIEGRKINNKIEYDENSYESRSNNVNTEEPSPKIAVSNKVIGCILCAIIFQMFKYKYSIEKLKENDFLNDTSIFYKLWFCTISTTIVRFKYHHVWFLADAIYNNSGLGFTGYDKNGSSKWDLVTNNNFIPFEFSTNLRGAIRNWNMGTHYWLRYIVYERTSSKLAVILTFEISALWHGFYPGYYVTFGTFALFVVAARRARKLLKHRFQRNLYTRKFYDIVTCLITRIVIGYSIFPFVLLEFTAVFNLYMRLYFCLHIVGLLTIFVLPKFISAAN